MYKYYSLSKNLKLIKEIVRETEGMDDQTYKMVEKTLGYIWINHKQYKQEKNQDYDLGKYQVYTKKKRILEQQGRKING